MLEFSLPMGQFYSSKVCTWLFGRAVNTWLKSSKLFVDSSCFEENSIGRCHWLRSCTPCSSVGELELDLYSTYEYLDRVRTNLGVC